MWCTSPLNLAENFFFPGADFPRSVSNPLSFCYLRSCLDSRLRFMSIPILQLSYDRAAPNDINFGFCGFGFGFWPLITVSPPSTELYLMSQGSCGCVNSTIACGATAAKVAPAVDLAPLDGQGDLNIMQDGVWYDSATYTTYGTQYWAFDVPASLASSCPMIRFELQLAVGTMSAFISARTIPTSSTYDFQRSFNGHSWIMICPTQPQFYYGRYYVNIANAAGRSTNIFRLRYSIINSPTCLNRNTLPPPEVAATMPPQAAASTWISDGIVNSFTATNINTMKFFKMYAPGRCTNISASFYRTSSSQDWSFLYVGANTNAIPSDASLGNTIAYARMTEAWINVQYCNPNATQDFNVFYFGILMRSLNTLHFVATTDQYIPPIALSSLYYTQQRQELMYGATPSLDCPTGQHICRYFGYRGCDAAGLSQCCYHLNPAPAEEHVQTFWPWNAADTSVGQFHQTINWVDMKPLIPGKLAWGLNMEWSDATTRTVNTDVDPSQCKMILGRGFVNSKFEPLQVLSINFTEKARTCNYQNYINVSQTIQSLTDSYLDGTTVDTTRENLTPAAITDGGKNTVAAVALQQLRIAIASWDDGYLGCQDKIFTEYANISKIYNDTESYKICTEFPGTAAWTANACCNSALSPTISCIASTVPELLPITGSVRKAAMASDTCANPQCAQSAVESLIYTQNGIDDASTGCLTALDDRASVDESTNRLRFTYGCVNNLLNTDLLGMRCNYTSECRAMANSSYGVFDSNITCDAYKGRCNFTPREVIKCMANQIDSDTAIGLFGQWKIPQKPTVALLEEAFNSHWISNQCSGPNAAHFRDGFRFGLVTPGCLDYCGYMNLEPYCVDTTKSRTEACAVPSICDFSVNASACWRNWQVTTNDSAACTSSKICNWRRSLTDPCPYTDTGDCTAACENATLPEFVCADCSQDITGTCLEVESITDETTCAAGRCTTNSNITDVDECEASGTCTARCNNCTQSECESTGTCSDYVRFRSLIDAGATGVCTAKRNFSTATGGYLCTAPWTNVGWMCARMDVTVTEAICSSSIVGGAPAIWYSFATDETTCTTNAGGTGGGYFCYQLTNSQWTYRNQSQCDLCGDDCIWTTPFSWGNGNWTSGRMQSLSWYKRAYVSSASMAPAVNLNQATRDVNEAITRDFAYAYYTDALCRYDSMDDLVKSVVCDCDTDDASECFTNRAQAAIGAVQVCPYQYRNLATAVATVTIPTTSVPATSTCQQIDVAETSVGKYQVPPDHSVTHALFSKINNNPYLVVVNDNNAVVGQLISDAATITLEFVPEVPIQLCVLVQDFIDVESSLSHYMLAKVNSKGSITTYEDGTLASEAQVSASEFTEQSTEDGVTDSDIRRRVCGYIDQSGTWFAVAVAPNYRTLTQNPRGEAIAAACLYLALLVFCMIQALLIFLDRKRQRLLLFKEVALGIVAVNAAIRTAYVLLPSDHFKSGTESLQFILFEAPTFFCFSVFTVIVYLWSLVVLNTRRFGRPSRQSRLLRNIFIVANVFMYAIFVVFIYLIAILPAKTATSPCFLGNLDSAITDVEKKIKVAYWIYQMVVAVLLAVGFLVSVIYLLRILYSLQTVKGSKTRRTNSKSSSSLSTLEDEDGGRGRHREDDHQERKAGRDSTDTQMIIITIVALFCIGFLVARSAVFLEAAINSSTLHVIVFCVLEVVPQAMLVFYLHPFRCFREAGRKTSTRASNSGVSHTYSSVRETKGSKVSTKSSGRSANPSAVEMEFDDKKGNGVANGHGKSNGKSNGKPSTRPNPASAVASSSGAVADAPRRAPNKGAKPVKSQKTGLTFTNTSDDEASSDDSSISESRSSGSDDSESSP